jgi:hypothetical protein
MTAMPAGALYVTPLLAARDPVYLAQVARIRRSVGA